MKFIRVLFVSVIAAAGVSCADGLAPTPDALTGRWSTTPAALSPGGQYVRSYDFTADRKYVRTVTTRGVYPQLQPDAVASIYQEYGSYVLHADTLLAVRDSVRSWDWLSGEYRHVGPPGISIEGPPTAPVIELTPSRLTLRYMVNPGDRYVPVVEVYVREP